MPVPLSGTSATILELPGLKVTRALTENPFPTRSPPSTADRTHVSLDLEHDEHYSAERGR